MRQQVGAALQVPFLFSGTLAANIRFAKPGFTGAEVVQAAHIKCPCHRILKLDEARSTLDLETEERIHAALAILTEGRTVIDIAHRLATLSRANRLVVIDAGRIVEMGSHRELMAGGGIYLAMVEAQRAFSEAQTLSGA